MSKRRPLTRPVEDHEESEGRERWLISYADFITLLMAFFVVMYSISSVNTGKFRVLSNSLETMLAPVPNRPVPIDLGGGATPRDGLLDASRNIAAVDEPSGSDAVNVVTPDIVAPTAVPVVGTPREKLEAVLGEMGGRDDVEFRETKDWLEIVLGSELLFPSGSAKLNVSANAALAKIAGIAADMGHPVRVEGFTDNVALLGGPYGSNWGLSAARAASVAERMAAGRVRPERLSAVGFGEHRPIADNATPEGRRQNRRVVVAIAKNDNVKLAADGDVANQAAEEPAKQEPAQSLQRVSELPGPAEIAQ